MMKYRKKPIVIEATQWDGTWEDHFRFLRLSPVFFTRSDVDNKRQYLWIKTLEGEHLVSPMDWVIKGINREYYPCKPDIFEKTYEKVEE